MPKNTDEKKKPTRRTQVKELPKEDKELTKEEAKKVKGGTSSAFLWVGSAKPKE